MHIRKLRLLTPGPTPLYPPAVRAMAGADIHHRTEEFRGIYKEILSGLQYFMGTANDVIVFTSSGSGAMESAVSNLFSPGDKVIVCSAGKFGERWVEIAKAYGLEATVLESPYGDAVSPERVAEALKADPAFKACSCRRARDLDRRRARREGDGGGGPQDGCDLRRRRDHGLGTMPLDIDGWGLDVVIGGSQKAFMIPPGLAFLSVSAEGLEARRRGQAAALLLQFEEGEEERRSGESSWTPATSLLLALAEALRYVRESAWTS